MRLRRMAAAPGDRDGELVGRGEHRAGIDAEGPDRHARHVVHAVDLLDVPAVHQPVLDHCLAAAAAFLGRLEDQHRGAVEIARLGKVARRAEQHRHVPVMAAGMHLAGNGRGIVCTRLLEERQRIHVGTEADHPAASVAPAVDDADHARPPDTGRHLVDAERPQLLGDRRRRPVHLVEDFRMPVQVVPPGGDVVGQFGEAIDDRHGCGSRLRRRARGAAGRPPGRRSRPPRRARRRSACW